MKKALLVLLSFVALNVYAQDEVLFLRAKQACSYGNPTEAVKLFSKLIEKEPTVKNYYWLAVSTFKDVDNYNENPDDYLKALKLYEKVYQMDTTYLDAYLGMANCKFQRVYMKRRDRKNPIDKQWGLSELDEVEKMYRFIKERKTNWMFFENRLIGIAEEREKVEFFGK